MLVDIVVFTTMHFLCSWIGLSRWAAGLERSPPPDLEQVACGAT